MKEQEIKPGKRRGLRLLAKGTAIFVLLALLALGAKQLNFDELFSFFGSSAGSELPWYRGEAGFLVLAGLLVALAVPRQVVSFFAAFTFGLWPGLLIAIAATTLGCVLDYCAGRVFKGFVSDLIFGKLQVALSFWKQNPFTVSLIIRLLPAGSNFVTSLAAGAAGLPASRFLAGSCLGYVPQTLVFGLLGSGVNIDSAFQIILSVALFAVSGLLGLWVYRSNRQMMRHGQA